MTEKSVTTRVYLLKRPRKVAGKLTHFYVLRWTERGGKQRSESLGRTSGMTKALAKQKRAGKEVQLNTPPDPDAPVAPAEMTLGQFIPFYVDKRSRGDAPPGRQTMKRYRKLGPTTVRDHVMTLRYMVAFFGEDQLLGEIDELGAEAWHGALAEGKLSGCRDPRRGDKLLSENTLRGRVRTAKSIFGWCKAHRLIRVSPFAEFTGAAVPTAPNPYVTLEDYRAVCEHAPPAWAAMFSLCRLAGLRRSEALGLLWNGTAADVSGVEHAVGINWDAFPDIEPGLGLISLVGKAGRYRQVPIRPELMAVLTAALDKSPDGSVRVCQAITTVAIHHAFREFCKAADVKPWAKPYQSLRSSCENDWKEQGIPEPTYLSWLGHSMEVSRRHYVTPIPSEFVKVCNPALSD